MLAATCEWDRLLRIADLIGVSVGGVGDEGAEVRGPWIHLANDEEREQRDFKAYGVADRSQMVALLIAGRVADREGYGRHAFHEWRRELAGLLLGRELPPSRDKTTPTVRVDAVTKGQHDPRERQRASS